MDNTSALLPYDPELDILRLNKQSGYNFRERRQNDWEENYTLYRDKVFVNRLTQRQAVNLPLMKQHIRTLLKDVDDMPVLYFENRDNDKDKEIFLNEYWSKVVEDNSLEIQDVADKKQVFMFGRSFDQWQIINGKVVVGFEDPQDILVDRYVKPHDVDTSRFLIHTHIFVPFSQIKMNDKYDKDAIDLLELFYATKQGLVKSAENAEMLAEKNKRMADLGLKDVDEPILGETIVELSLHFIYRPTEDGTSEELYCYTEADNMQILRKEKLESIIGVTTDHYWRNHFPYNSWADDLEVQDFWSDGVADVIRPSNKVLNAWYSQLVENRTLRNFGMHYYDSSLEGFEPSTYQPMPWGWYGVPVPQGGRITDIIQKVDIPDLSDSLDEMQFVINMLEKSTGATATQQGVQTEKKTTLGEVQLALTEAKDRIKGMSKFYTHAWKKRGEKFLKLIEAGADKIDAVKLYKKGRDNNSIYQREISPKDWMSKSGYSCKVWSQDEKSTNDMNKLQKLMAVRGMMPGNMALDEIIKRKDLEFADLTPDEINRVMEEEKTKIANAANINGSGAMGLPTPGGSAIPGLSVGQQQPNQLAGIPGGQ